MHAGICAQEPSCCPGTLTCCPSTCSAGNVLRSSKIDFADNLKKYGKRGTMLGWYEVQLAFFRTLPPGTVSLDSR